MEEAKFKDLEFSKILIEISKVEPLNFDDSKKKNLTEQLKHYYDNNGRHQYSDIAGYIYSRPDEIEYLVSNLKELYNYANEELKVRIFKIIDHIKLEKIRLQYLEEENRKQSLDYKASKRSIGLLHRYLDGVKEETRTVHEELKELHGKVNKFNMESITILGIFSGIVMAFFGGMSFFNEVLKNMHTVSKYRITFIALTIGFILFNTIFLFMYCIGKLVDKPIKNECLFDKCSECDNKCKIGKKLKNLYPILFYVDLFFLISLLTTFILWLLNKIKVINL